MTYMAVFDVGSVPRVTVKPMTTRDGLRYKYYVMGKSAEDARQRLSDRLKRDAGFLHKLAETYEDAAAGKYDGEAWEDV